MKGFTHALHSTHKRTRIQELFKLKCSVSFHSTTDRRLNYTLFSNSPLHFIVKKNRLFWRNFFQINFPAPPTIMPFLFPNKLLNEGMRSAVSCQILEGSLPIEFDWTKDGLSLGPSGIDGVTIRSNDEYSSTLIVDHLKFLHRGNYTCKASNAAGFASHSAELTVNGILVI